MTATRPIDADGIIIEMTRYLRVVPHIPATAVTKGLGRSPQAAHDVIVFREKDPTASPIARRT